MVQVRRGAALVTVLCTAVALNGCSTQTTGSATSAVTAQVPSVAAERKVDLSRLAQIADGFPPGQVVNPLFGPQRMNASELARVGDLVANGAASTVSPDSCRVLLKPAHSMTGSDTVAITSATGPQDPFIAVSVDDPVAVPAAIPKSGCDRFTFAIDGATPDGAVDRLPVPTFDDAITYALKVQYTVDGSASEGQLVEYFYVAILDARSLVSVWARETSDFVPEPVLPNLLTKTVNVIRSG